MAQWKSICLPMQETRVQSLRREDPLEEEETTHKRTHIQTYTYISRNLLNSALNSKRLYKPNQWYRHQILPTG